MFPSSAGAGEKLIERVVPKTAHKKSEAAGPRLLLVQNSENFFFPHNEEIFTIDFDFRSGIFSEQNMIAGLDVQGENFAFIVRLAFADGDNFAFLGLFFCGVGNNNATADGFAFFDATDDDTVM
jgi:hypothetical protein